jgi:hypothetical protein
VSLTFFFSKLNNSKKKTVFLKNTLNFRNLITLIVVFFCLNLKKKLQNNNNNNNEVQQLIRKKTNFYNILKVFLLKIHNI